MSLLELNKIIASIIVAIIVIGIISILGDLILNKPNNELAKNAYNIEIEQSESTNESNIPVQNENLESISIFLANASLENGKKIFKKCSACHTYQKEGANKVGPNLWNLINKPKASVSGFAYSKALAEFGGTWGYEELNQFFYKPKEYIEGTKMNFSGLKKSEDRADLILFLREQAEEPASLQ